MTAGQGWIGILIYLIGTITMAVGAALQKRSLNENNAKAPETRRPPYKQALWVVGILLYSSSGILYSLALIFAPQSTVAPLISFLLVESK